jgi:hypothetical protein
MSEARWFDEDSSAEAARTRGGAAASGESVLHGHIAQDYGFRNGSNNLNHTTGIRGTTGTTGTNGNGLNGTSSKWVSTTNEGVAVDVSERKRVLHDPRFSGLFGNVWDGPNDESHMHNQRHTAYTVDVDLDSNGHDRDPDEHEYDEREREREEHQRAYGSSSRVLRVSLTV